jgi:hypothetical protein
MDQPDPCNPPPTLSATDPNYWPVNTVSKDGAITGKGFVSQNGTDVDAPDAPDLIFTVIIPPSTDGKANTQKVEFELSDVSSLTGYATNACFKPDCSSEQDTGPDFIFEKQANFDDPSPDGKKIRTSNKVQKIKVKVTSRDYGGTATLQATVDPDGTATPAIVKETGLDYTNIPIDQDGNGIADSWEQMYGGTLDPTADNEPGPTPDSPTGDGLNIFEEYRGLVVLQNGSNTLLRSDPVNTRDVFFWDPTHLFGPALHALLEPQTQGVLLWHEVEKKFANPAKPGHPEAGVARLNFASSATTKAYAVVYANYTSPLPGVLGESPDIWGSSAVKLDSTKIRNFAQMLAFPEDVLRAQVVAHETGHRLSRDHPVRPSCCVLDTSIDPRKAKQLDQIGLNAWAVNPKSNKQIYVRYTTYWYAQQGQRRMADHVDTDIGYPAASNALYNKYVSSQTSMSTQGTDQIVKVVLDQPPDAGNPDILINNLTQHIMDWTEDLNIRTLEGWTFTADDLNNFRPKP